MKTLKYILYFVLLGGITVATTIYLMSDNSSIEFHSPEPSIPDITSDMVIPTTHVPRSVNWTNTHLTELMQNELERRTRCSTNSYINSTVEVDYKFRYDYGVEQNNGNVILKSKDQKTARWLIDQYIRYLSETDTCINADNLPPMIIDFKNVPYGNFDFAYREPHFSFNLEHKLHPVSGAHSVEEHWDLWGHNLPGELLKYGLDKNIYMSGNPRQICFSKQILFDSVSEYLKRRAESSNHRLNSRRLLIMPLDNMVACECSRCRALGNRHRYATPAVVDFIDRLAGRFPDYTFFTAAYHSTAQPPNKRPKHRIGGVMMSASELYTGELDQQKKEREFWETAMKWKNFTDTLYVWDYAANFNDYLTPLPVLYVLKKKLKFFRECGINGIFLQGSSYDYSPFDEVKTYVATALMINGRLDIDVLCHHYFAQFYPVSAEILADYYLSLEKTMEQRQLPCELHGNLGNAIDSYFIVDDFLEFYRKLGDLVTDDKLDAMEKKRLEKMYTALSFTWLQIELYRQTGSYDIEKLRGRTLTMTPEIETVINRLSKLTCMASTTIKKRMGVWQIT